MEEESLPAIVPRPAAAQGGGRLANGGMMQM